MEGLYMNSLKKYTDVQEKCDIFGIFRNTIVFPMIPKVLHFFSVSDESKNVAFLLRISKDKARLIWHCSSVIMTDPCPKAVYNTWQTTVKSCT